MNCRYVLMDPTKNITALAETRTPPACRRSVADAMMRNEPSCEQAGFVYRDESGGRCLQMAGGEFCGNAAMSAAALFCKREGIRPGETRILSLRVSGAADPVAVRVTADGDARFFCEAAMPPPERISRERLTLDGREFLLPTVFFPGIAHCIVPAEALTRSEAERAVKRWCAALAVKGLGLMLLDRASLTLTPLVYIPAADTLFWESSCASGTTAVGAYIAQSEGTDVDLCVREPGGTLRVRADADGLRLMGSTEILYEKEIEVG